MKLDLNMIIRCMTEDEFNRIGKLIDEFYKGTNDVSYAEMDYYEGIEYYSKGGFCFDTWNPLLFNYDNGEWYEKLRYKIIDSTEIE